MRYSTSTVTDGYKGTSTSTVFTTTTTTSVSISTSTSTSTSVVQVYKETVVPAPAGFIPVQSSLPESTFTNNTMARRSLDLPHKRAAKKQKQYPKMVQCNVYTPSKQCVIKHKTVTKTKQASYPETSTVKVRHRLARVSGRDFADTYAPIDDQNRDHDRLPKSSGNCTDD